MHNRYTGYFAFILGLLLVFTSQVSFGQSRTQQFNQLLDKNDSARAQVLLSKWKRDLPNDPEWFVARYNYLVWSSMKSVFTIGSTPKGDNYMQLSPTDSSANAEPQFMYADVAYNPDVVKSAIICIDSAIVMFPDRLDLRFGKIYLLGETKAYGPFADEIVKTIHYGASIKHAWKWTDNEPIDGGVDAFYESIQSYIVQLYDTNEDSLGVQIGQIASAVLEHNPDDVINLSNLSISYMLQSNYEQALIPLLKAEKIDPSDAVVLSNIAFCYHRINDKPNAILYYERAIKYGDPETQAYSREQIELIKAEQ